MNLKDLVTMLPEVDDALHIENINMTDVFGEVNGKPTIFQFVDPTTPDLFRVPELTKRIQTQFPDWPASLLQNVALMSICYYQGASSAQNETEPKASGEKQAKSEVLDPDQVWLYFAHLIERTKKKPEKFLTLKTRFLAKFPHLNNMGAAEKQAAGE